MFILGGGFCFRLFVSKFVFFCVFCFLFFWVWGAVPVKRGGRRGGGGGGGGQGG